MNKEKLDEKFVFSIRYSRPTVFLIQSQLLN